MRHNALKTFDGKAAATTDQIPAAGPALSNTAPVALAAAASAGSSYDAARADHAHPTTGLVLASEKGAANGVAELGADGKVPSAQLPTILTAADARKIAKKQALIFG